MKNISRRVFIKGMAVAAVATAASTVLAGCNFVPGTEETVVTGFAPETKTITIGEESVTVSTTSFSVTADNFAKVGLKVVNNADENITVKAATTASDNELALTSCFDGQYNTVAKVADKGSNVESIIDESVSHNESSSTDTKDYTKSGYVYVELPEKWSTLTLICTLTLGTETKEVTFTLSK